MKNRRNQVIATLASAGAFIAGMTCGTTHAQTLIATNNSALANVFGVSTGPEALVIGWSVVESATGVYTYTYTVNNPAGDVLLTSAETAPTGTPEIVDSFSVGFNTTLLGAFIPGSQAGGAFDLNNGVNGLTCGFCRRSGGQQQRPSFI